jgi:tRNA nucleotidyltransferase (CCA-adding enzyme)
MPLESSFIPYDVREIMDRIIGHDFDAWIVGGALRDHMLGLPPRDWDIGTDAAPEHIMKLFRKVVPIGIRHGTVEVITGTRSVEVTTFPAAGKRGLLEDLARRDFTVNAMAYSSRTGELLDPHGGARDLELLTLRAVGDPRMRFREDPLRTLRAGRFVSVYGFRIDGSTHEAIGDEVQGIGRVAAERIREEMFKMVLGEHVVDAFECMGPSGVLMEVLPELAEEEPHGSSSFSPFEQTVRIVSRSPRRLPVRLAALFHGISKPVPPEAGGKAESQAALSCEADALTASRIMERWRCSNKLTRDVMILVLNRLPRGCEAMSDAQIRHFIARAGEEHVGDLLDLYRAERLAESDDEKSMKELDLLRTRIYFQLTENPAFKIESLAVDGRDVMEVLGLGPGPAIGHILRRLHRAVLEDPGINERNILMDYIKNMPY